MTPKEYLRQIRRLDTQIKTRRCEIDALRSIADMLSGSGVDGMPHGSSNGDKMADAVARITEKERQLDDFVDYFLEARDKVLKTLELMDDPILIDILYRRYFSFQSWELIAVEMGYTYRHVLRLHDKGIESLGSVMKNGRNK